MNLDNREKYNVNIKTTWILETADKDLKNTLTFDSSNKSVNLEDVVNLDTCIHLLRNEEKEQKNKEPCNVTVATLGSSTDMISGIVLVSEARILEVFGSCGEYITTLTAEYVDDFEDCSVYMAEYNIKPVKQITFKFQRTKHADSLWLYGINLRICQKKGLLTNLSTINYQSVNEMLKETKIPISENAEKCKTFLQTYCSGKAPAPNSQMLMKIMEAEYFNSFGATGKTMSNCISNLVPLLSTDKSETDSCSSSQFTCVNHSASDLVELRAYIDNRFGALENRIVKIEQKVNDIESKHTEKLDHIILLLNRLIRK